MKPKSHGRMKRYAVHVSRSRKLDSQRRAREGPGAVLVRTATSANYLLASIAACASFCAWSSACFGDCWPVSTRWIAEFRASVNFEPAGVGGSSKPYLDAATRIGTALSYCGWP